MTQKEFEQELEQARLFGYWFMPESTWMPVEPLPRITPQLWKWREIEPLLYKAGELVTVGEEAMRRNLVLQNPDLKKRVGNFAGPAPTIAAGIQMVKPGEIAPAHRHTQSALRFVIRGKGAYTAVDGEKLVLGERDLVVGAPVWAWHHHGNDSDAPIIWMDVLDAPLVAFLGATFFEPYPEPQQPITKPEGYTGRRAGSLWARPVGTKPERKVLPAHYRWKEAYKALVELSAGEGDPYDGAAMEYINPVTGGHTTHTFSCWLHLFRPGEHTKAHRHTSTMLCHVVQGRGYSILNGELKLEWEQGDTFVVPQWVWHEHANAQGKDETILFSVNDAPIFEVFELFREEAYPKGYQ